MMKSRLAKTGRIIAVSAVFLFASLVPQPAFASDKFYTSVRVNLRSGPGTNHSVFKTVPQGVAVSVSEYNPDGWSKVAYNNVSGYMKSDFISSSIPENAPPVSPGGVSLMSWSEARNVVKVGVPISVYDVRSGLTYQIRSFSNGRHADVEPITTQDTEIMKRTYGGVWSWDPRPVWVTVGNVTIAAAINGMPHGGGVNNNNGMNGQVCLHFKDSSVHNGNMTYNSQMQLAVRSAFEASR